MKRCLYCGAEYPDDMDECPIDHSSTTPSAPPTREAGKGQQERPAPNRTRVGLRFTGIILLLLALLFFVTGLGAVKAGDVDVGYSHEGLPALSNGDSRIAFLLAIAGVACIGYSFGGGNGKSDHKD